MICIVGGGPAGVAAARALIRAGHRDVTLLEREPRIGGKCRTIAIGETPVELGATLVMSSYRTVHAMARERGHAVVPFESFTRHCVHTDRDGHLPVRVGASLRYLRHAVWLGRRSGPGFAGAPPELHAPFLDWAQRRGMSRAQLDVFEHGVACFGYGDLDEIAALYVLELATPRISIDYLLAETLSGIRATRARERGWPLPGVGHMSAGYEGLLSSVLRGTGVRVVAPATIRRIDRTSGGGTIELCRADHDAVEHVEFDRLIVATTPDHELRAALDLDPLERPLLEGVRTYRYYSLAVQARGGAPSRMAEYLHAAASSIPRGITRSGKPHIAIAHPLGQGRSAYVFYGYLQPGETLAAATDECRRVVADVFGGEVERVPEAREWRYFPHVTTNELRAGFYDELEALQGHRSTYYTGAMMNGEYVEAAAAYSQHLVARRF